MLELQSHVAGRWIGPGASPARIHSAINGSPIALLGGSQLDFAGMKAWAVQDGGPGLRAMGFHERAKMLKALAAHLSAHKETLYELSYSTGATRADSWIDIDGGIGTMMVYASKGRRELPDGDVLTDGDIEMLSRKGSFIGQHVCLALTGVAVQVNAFNFPVWGMLEKLSPSLLAGMPAIIKPASATAHVAEAAFRIMLESGLLPEGAIQLVCGSTGNLFDLLDFQDVVSFTGSAATGRMLARQDAIVNNSVRFIAEQDSLNASLLGPDAGRQSPEFDLLVKEVVTEMTAKAGQKCTAIRRIIVPGQIADEVGEAVSERLAGIVMGDPRREDVTMGALVSRPQREDVLARADAIAGEARLVHEGAANDEPELAGGAFMAPRLYLCRDPDGASAIHESEAFGPVATILPYRDLEHGCALANRGGGSLVTSLITHDVEVAKQVVHAVAPMNGRIYINNRDSAGEATGHGSPLPHMVHGGPGRAGGGEELGGIRGVLHYMQRTAVQGSPAMISAITGSWVSGAPLIPATAHPFTRKFGELAIGETLEAGPRTVTLEDIEHFAEFTGDNFYAHMDEEAARANPFFPGRVAHGYLLLAFAAGLFVQPDPGPVLANTGLEGLRFLKPVSPGDAISVRLTVKRKTRRTAEYGEVRWNVLVSNQEGEPVAEYELHTMNLYQTGDGEGEG